MKYLSKVALALGTVSLLAACGGGDGGGGAASGVFSGRVIDGYIRGATVCLDLNSNAKCDAGEPSATTTAGGAYSFTYSGSVAGLHVIAEVPVGATDEDLGPVANPYSLFAPATSPSTVTPLTTLVSSEMMSSGSTAAEAESSVKVSLGISADLLANNFKASGDTTIQSTAQKIVAAVAEAKRTLDNNATVTSAALTPGQIITQAVKQVKNDVLPGLIAPDGSISKSEAEIKTAASANVSGNVQNIVAKTKAGDGSVLSLKDAFSAGLVLGQKSSGQYLVGDTPTDFSNRPVVEYLKTSFTGATSVDVGTVKRVLLESGQWTSTYDANRDWLLVNGVWARRLSNGPMTVSGNCVTVKRTSIGSEEKYCAVRRDVTGKGLSTILPGLCDGDSCTGHVVATSLPEGSYVYDLTASVQEDQYNFWVNETWGGYLTQDYTDNYNATQVMTLTAFINYTADETHKQFEGQNCNTAFWFPTYNSATKTGTVNWKRNTTDCSAPELSGPIETTNFTIKNVGGVDIMVAETSPIFRTGSGNDSRQLLMAFAHVPPAPEDGRPLGGIRSGNVRLKNYSQRIEFNGDFRNTVQIMSKPVYLAIQTALGLPAFQFPD
jgi:hypothetical protein